MFFKKKEVAAPEGNIPEICNENESCSKKPRRGMIAKLWVMMAAFALMVVTSGVIPVLASDATTTTSGIDMTLANQLIELIKAVNTLFTVYPINIFLIASLVLVAFRVFRGAKKTATK